MKTKDTKKDERKLKAPKWLNGTKQVSNGLKNTKKAKKNDIDIKNNKKITKCHQTDYKY